MLHYHLDLSEAEIAVTIIRSLANDSVVPRPASGPASGVPAYYAATYAPGSSSPARLTRLTVPAAQGRLSMAAALSPSGRELAVPLDLNTKPSRTIALRIYSVATGKLLRSWSTRAVSAFGGSVLAEERTLKLTWVGGDQAVAFTTREPIRNPGPEDRVAAGVRLLNVTASDGDLIKGSRLVWSKTVPSNPVSTGACLAFPVRCAPRTERRSSAPERAP